MLSKLTPVSTCKPVLPPAPIMLPSPDVAGSSDNSRGFFLVCLQSQINNFTLHQINNFILHQVNNFTLHQINNFTLHQIYGKEVEPGQNIQEIRRIWKYEEYGNKKTSKLSRTPRPYKKSHKGFSFKLHQCYPKINLSLYLKNKTSITCSENFKIQSLPLPNLPIYSKHLAYEKIYFQSFYLTTNILFENCLIIYQIQMQFPNCTAKVSVLCACAKHQAHYPGIL